MFSRFKAMEEFGEEELQNLQNSKVAVVGAGATGSVMAEHLARHGVSLLLIDRDYLERNDIYSSNIYRPEQCKQSMPKAVAAGEYLSSFTAVEYKVESLNPDNIQQLEQTDLIVDGTDNMETRLMINDFSKKTGIPWIYTAALAGKGYSMFFDDKCFNCVFRQMSLDRLESCETAGILREASGIAGSISARKAVKHLSGKKVEEKLDTVSGESFEVETNGCKVCEGGDYSHLQKTGRTISVCGENKYQLDAESSNSRQRLKELGKVKADNSYLTRASVNGREITLFESGRVILEARDRGHAEAIVSELGL